MTIEEPPQRTDADRRAALGQLCLQLDERDVILGLDRASPSAFLRHRLTSQAKPFAERTTVLPIVAFAGLIGSCREIGR